MFPVVPAFAVLFTLAQLPPTPPTDAMVRQAAATAPKAASTLVAPSLAAVQATPRVVPPLTTHSASEAARGAYKSVAVPPAGTPLQIDPATRGWVIGGNAPPAAAKPDQYGVAVPEASRADLSHGFADATGSFAYATNYSPARMVHYKSAQDYSAAVRQAATAEVAPAGDTLTHSTPAEYVASICRGVGDGSMTLHDGVAWLTQATHHYVEAGRLDLARAAAEAAVGLAPEERAAWLWRTHVRVAERDFAGAAADSERALALAPDDAMTRYNHARLLALAGRPDAAAAVIRGSIARYPRAAAFHAQFATHELRRGHLAKAEFHATCAAWAAAFGLADAALAADAHALCAAVRLLRGEVSSALADFAEAGRLQCLQTK